MTYVSFDETSDTTLSKEREACFTSGCNGESLAQYITDALAKHKSQSAALYQTIAMFKDDEPKKRLHGKVTARYEQERKWVKHFEACANEHKKGSLVSKLKTELEHTKKEGLKNLQNLRSKHETDMADLRKQCRVTFRKEFEDELKAKEKAKKKKSKKHWYDWIVNIFSDKDTEADAALVVPAKMVAKEAVPDTGAKPVVKDRAFYLARRAAKGKV